MKCLVRSCVCLLLGAITTLGVAGCIATLVRLPAGLDAFHVELIHLQDADLWIARTQGTAIVEYSWSVETGGFLYEGRWEQVEPVPSTIPRWTGLRDRALQDANDPIHVFGTGWPMLACRASIQTRRYVQSEADFRANKAAPTGEDIFVVRDGFGLQWPRTRFGKDDPRGKGLVLPLAPIWPGFLVDAASYAGPWCLVLFAPGFLRRHFRLRRNHCPHCNYDLRATAPASPCPECGQPMTVAK